MKICFFLALALFLSANSRAQTQINQSTLVGQIQLAEVARGQVDLNTSVLDQYATLYQQSNGGPRLAKLGIQLGQVIQNTYAADFMSVILAIGVGLIWLNMIKEGKGFDSAATTLALKFMVGMLVFHLPSLLYAVGMTTRDFGVKLAELAFTSQAVGPTLSQLSVSGSPEALSFEQIRAEAIDRAIKDLGQPMNGVGANIAFDLYNQLVTRAGQMANGLGQDQSGTGADTSFPTIQGDAIALEKSRMIAANLSKLLQVLQRTDTATSFTFTSYRVGQDSLPDTTAGVSGGIFDNESTTGSQGLQGTINGSTIQITVSTLNAWLTDADSIRTQFEQQAAQGSFTSSGAYDSALKAALESYGNMVYVRTGGFIKKSFWDDLGFACGAEGGSTWSYLSTYSADQKNAVVAAQTNLLNWYQNTTGRAAASYSAAATAQSTLKGISKAIVGVLGFVRDKCLTTFANTLFDLIIEVYVFLLWATFPLWFIPGTQKAFTGALNVFVMACVTPSVLTLCFVIWDAFISYMIYLSSGGAFL